MASEIAKTYTERREGFTIVTVLTGSLIFLADLIRRLPMRMKIARHTRRLRRA